MKNVKAVKNFDKLIEIMKRLRGADGCAWDKKQTHESLVKYLVSETKEVKQAVKNQDYQNLCEELGDVLLQIVFHAQVACENKKFNIADVVDTLNKKLIRRHPHVFGKTKVKNVREIVDMWDKIKKKEKLKLKKQYER
jgi:tetrapyrrole methylase family protein/MazG family protein